MLDVLKKLALGNRHTVPVTHASFSTNALQYKQIFRKDKVCISPVNNLKLIRGKTKFKDDAAFLVGAGSVAELIVQDVRAVALVFLRHPWSGSVKITVNDGFPLIFNLGFPFKIAEPFVVAVESENTHFQIRLEILEPLSTSPESQEAILWKVITDSAENYIHPLQMPRDYTSIDSSSQKIDTYYENINQAQFIAWDNHIKNLGLTDIQAKEIVTNAYIKRLEKVFSGAPRGAKTLDIGCGFWIGKHLHSLMAKYDIEYYGHDISSSVFNNNNSEMSQYGWNNRFTLGRNTELPYENESFPFIYSGHCLEHSDDIEKTCSEIFRVLAPTGKVHFFVPISWDESPEHIYYFNTLCWATLFMEYGFAIESMTFGKHYNPLQKDYDSEIVMTKQISKTTP